MRSFSLSLRAFNWRALRFYHLLTIAIAVMLVSTSCQKTPPPTAPPPTAAAAALPTTVPTPIPTPAARPTTPAPTLPPTPVPAPATTLDIPVTVRGASNLGSLQLELRFDPQALELKGVKAGPLARNALVDSRLSAPGRAQIGLVAASGVSGDGVIIILTFAPAGKAGPVSLTVEQLQAADTDLRDLVVTTTPGQFSGAGSQASGPAISFRK